MREKIFATILRRLEKRMPEMARRLELQILMQATAKAFGVSCGSVLLCPWEAGLSRYAAFTVRCMEGAADRNALRKEAQKLGERIRLVTGFADPSLGERLVVLLYRNIGIDASWDSGEFTVHSCFFASMYTPGQCAFMSAMDAGVICGILGGGDLRFSRRITEGCPCCRAKITWEENDGC